MSALSEAKLVEAEQEFEALKAGVREAAKNKEAIHVLEKRIWGSLLRLGKLLLQAFIQGLGKGDMGQTFTLEDGRRLNRLDELKRRRYLSIFGLIEIWRFVYGTREKQKHQAVPLDAQVQLPENDTSYVLQDWDQSFCVHNPFEESRSLVARILDLKQSVATLELMNHTMGADAEAFQREQKPPAPADEAGLLVVTSDGKGVPMRRERQPEGEAQAQAAPQPDAARDPNGKNKRMAYVGAVYTIEPFARTPAEIVDQTLRDQVRPKQPKPQNKRLRADLTREFDGVEWKGRDAVFRWLADEVEVRDPEGHKPLVCLLDGEKALAKAAKDYLPKDRTDILDIIHALGKLRDAAHCFHEEHRSQAEAFVEQRLTKLLEGKAGYVTGGLRQMATKHRLRGKKKETIEEVTTYYQNNLHRMKYDEYLAAGYPIATGVAEGGCKHLVKDRMEGSGMRWYPHNAQAMLNLRAVELSGDWDEFCAQRIKNETRRLYPYRSALVTLN